MYDKKEVAAMFKCSVRKVEKMMAAGEIGYKKIGALVRFRESDIAPFFAGTTCPLLSDSARTIESGVVEKTRACEPVRGRS